MIEVSVIFPIRNESSCIEQVLAHASIMQDFPLEKMEFLIADGMSTDNTRALIGQFAALHPELQIRIMDNHGQIVPTGMNIALRQAKGQIIVRIDGHTLVAFDYVRQCVETLQRTKADNVGGKMNAVGNNSFGQAVALATSTPFGIGGGRFHYSDLEEWVDTVYMGAWPRHVFDKIGLFDEEFVRNQDDEFNYRLRSAGGKILLSPKIKSEYTVRSAPGSLWRQYFQYGYWKVRVLQKHPRQMSLRQFVPPVFTMALLVSALLAFIPFLRLLSWIVPLIYFIANISASLITGAQRNWRSFPLLPFIFSILHISYGLGFLFGLIKFAKRWGDKQGKVPSITT